ncbi:hypothetical protein AVEN_106045-1 [Araneus ventricosus]|uniref:Uncharacterized protein n=1 Tax=Araneus ventricosus TaxID=182803 RepID=A0A4Y2H129_ARAVE|nr:hypothetical protein AVEN_106045-1 [Araneus ventricosus]
MVIILTFLKHTVIKVGSWFGLKYLGGHNDSHVLHGGALTAIGHEHQILDPSVKEYAGDIGKKLILMDDNARPLRARLVEEYLEDEKQRIHRPSQSINLWTLTR